MKYIEDQILAWLQRRCMHPSEMVAVDILEGAGDDIEVGYCRRCGAVRLNYNHNLIQDWRRPDPNLWRG